MLWPRLEHLFESDTQLRQSPVGVDLQRELQHDRVDVHGMK